MVHASERRWRSALLLVNAVKQYWVSRGQLGLRYRLVVEALAHTDAQSRNLARCHGLFNAGQVCYFMGRLRSRRSSTCGKAWRSRARDRQCTHRGAPAHCLVFRRSGAEIQPRRGGISRKRLRGPASREIAGDRRCGQWALPSFIVSLENWTQPNRSTKRSLDLRGKLGTEHRRHRQAQPCHGGDCQGRDRSSPRDATRCHRDCPGHRFEAHGPERHRGDGRNGGLPQERWETAARFFGAAEAQVGTNRVAPRPCRRGLPWRRSWRGRATPRRTDFFDVAESAGRALSYEIALREADAFLEGKD